jgi:hypothetical protein
MRLPARFFQGLRWKSLKQHGLGIPEPAHAQVVWCGQSHRHRGPLVLGDVTEVLPSNWG